MTARKRLMINNEVAIAKRMKQLESVFKTFMKLNLLGDLMDTAAYKVGMPDPFSTTLFSPPVPEKTEPVHYLYNTYNFMDDLTKYDIFRRANHYSAVVPKRLHMRDEVTVAGLSVCASLEVRRRREHFKLRGKLRPQYDNYGRRMLESPRALVAKMQKYAHPYFGQIITSKKDDAQANTIAAVKRLDAKFQKRLKDSQARLKKFFKRNKAWIKNRSLCRKTPIFSKFPRDRLYANVVNRHQKLPFRRRTDQDLFSEFNYISSHLAFSVHFCRVVRSFRVNRVKENDVIQKASNILPLVRVHLTRYSYFPAVSVVNYNENEELETALPIIPRKAPSIAAISGFSSDSEASAATDTPLDWEFEWKLTDKELEHRMNFLGDTTRYTVQRNSQKFMNERKMRELTRRRLLLMKEDRRFELQDTVPIFHQLTKMHPPFFYCKLKSMELNKLRRARQPDDDQAGVPNEITQATRYLFGRRIEFLEKTLPCKDDPRIMLSRGWRVFAERENPENFKNVARILRQRSVWVDKNCMSRSATVPRCDKLPMSVEGKDKKLFLVLTVILSMSLFALSMTMINFI